MKQKRYALFTGLNHYPLGDWRDSAFSFEELEQVVAWKEGE